MEDDNFELTKTFSLVFTEIINLKYSFFLKMISELNSIAEYFIDDEGFKLTFQIARGTDKTFLWKLTVRIECIKSKITENNRVNNKSFRVLRLNQFINIYNHIKQQSEVLKTFDSSEKRIQPGKSSDLKGSASLMTESKLYDTIQSMSHSQIDEKEEEICCICMESKTNLILSCAHNFCEKCIREWQITHKSCPICRCFSGENDGFILADCPDYYNLQDEMSKSLFQITENAPNNKKSRIFNLDDSD